MRLVVLAILGSVVLSLAGCGNTANGLKRDGQDSSRALDNATHRVLSQSGR